MINFLVIETVMNKSMVVESLEEAAFMASINSVVLEFALEEYGVCETDKYTIVEIYFRITE